MESNNSRSSCELPVRSTVTCAVEGVLDEAVAMRIVREVGADPGSIHGKRGKPAVLKALSGFNRAAQHSPWLVMVDLDGGGQHCAPLIVKEHLPVASSLMCFRIAVHAVEAWLLADIENFSAFFSVAQSRLPLNPDSIVDPKGAVVAVAGTSRKTDIRRGVVPRPGSGRRVGATYSSMLLDFTINHWRPAVAAERSDSLRRCLDRLTEAVRR